MACGKCAGEEGQGERGGGGHRMSLHVGEDMDGVSNIGEGGAYMCVGGQTAPTYLRWHLCH